MEPDLSLDSQRLAFFLSNNTIRIWDAKTGEEVQALEDHSDTIGSVFFSPDRPNGCLVL